MPINLRLAPDTASSDHGANPAHVEETLAEIRRALPYGAQIAIERRTGIPAATIQDQLSSRPRHRASLLVVLEALSEIRASGPNGRRAAIEIHQALAEPLGHVVAESLPSSGGDPCVAFQRAVAEVGDVARLFADNPGPLSPALRVTLRREAIEAREALDAFMDALPGGKP